MNTDSELKARYGTKSPYKVPEGYFEQFHEQLMSRLPEAAPEAAPEAKITLMTRIKPLLYLAAMFVGIVFLMQGIAYVHSQQGRDEQIALEELYDDEADHFMSSSLYDEYVLYSYLTTADYE